MNKKLTLSLDENIIESAKTYAEKHNDSISKIVEKFFYLLALKNGSKIDETIIENNDNLDKIVGIIKLPEDYNEKDDYKNYRIEKLLND